MNPLHDKELYGPLCLKFQSMLVFQRNASLVLHGAGLGLATTLGSGTHSHRKSSDVCHQGAGTYLHSQSTWSYHNEYEH